MGIEIILKEGDRHPFCPHRLPSCTRRCRHWINEELGCSSLLMGTMEPDEYERALINYWAEIEKTDPACN